MREEAGYIELPLLKRNLLDGRNFSMGIFGDSISTGLNATGFTGFPPFAPPYFDIIVSEIKDIFSCEVTLTNESVAGKNSEWGLENIDNLRKHKPDLVILAWGMNDASRKCPGRDFKRNISEQIRLIRSVKAETEFLLLSGMTANPEWSHCSPESYLEYLEMLKELAREEKALVPVNITGTWLYLTERKSYLDLSGNGLNHPNDFGHRIYAQIILKSILDISGKNKID